MYCDIDQFDFTDELSSHWLTIKEELEQFSARGREGGFKNYPGHSMDWQTLPVYAADSEAIGAGDSDERLRILARDPNFFPQTRAILAKVPGIYFAVFSILKPGYHIQPHRDPFPELLRFHLGISIPQPEQCGLKVAGKIKQLKEGECLIFERGELHEAWNRGSQDRVILLVDFRKDAVLRGLSPEGELAAFDGRYHERYTSQEKLAGKWQQVNALLLQAQKRSASQVKRLIGTRAADRLKSVFK